MSLRDGLSVIGRICVLAIGLQGTAAAADLQSPWRQSPWFNEQSFTTAIVPQLRIHVNAPLDEAGEPTRAKRIIVYALPNGNTIEQTLGCQMAKGLDWHYDIQQVAAQVRLLRSMAADERIVLICAEANGLSWPSWRRTRPEANSTIARLVDGWRRQFGGVDAKVTLTGHSGGGSFMFGLIEANEDVPDYIDRIAYLDANYSFDAALHAGKLERWLNGDDSRRLIVLAYDDREIMLDGKKVVGPTGGTYRATGRMREALSKSFPLAETFRPSFQYTTGLDGRIHFCVHTNPENKILHTALVGEMNGLAHVATLGTRHEETWGKFGGPRGYTKWVQPEPALNEVQARGGDGKRPTAAARQLKLPGRPTTGLSGRQFVEDIKNLSLDEREAAIRREISRGNFPNFLRNFKVVTLRGRIKHGGEERDVVASIEVMPDYVAVGDDKDFIRMPMRPQTAQQIADEFGCVLPTRKIVDAIDAQAELRIEPHPMTHEREAVATFAEHNHIIRKQIGFRPDGQLVTGIKKDIVLSPRIFQRPRRLAIYGWRQLDGKPIQPLTIVHADRYVDYSHGARLVRNAVEIDGKHVPITELLADPNRCGLVSDEGTMDLPRYPLE